MDIEKLMLDAPDLADVLGERVMLRKPDGTPSIRRTPEGVDVGERYAIHGLRVVEKLAGRAQRVEAADWQESVAWFREQSDFVLQLVMRAEALASKKAALRVEGLEARLAQVEAENDALHDALDDARTHGSASARERLDAMLGGSQESSSDHEQLQSMRRRIAELEASLAAYRSAAVDSPAGPLLTVAGSAAAGWLLGKALTTPTKSW